MSKVNRKRDIQNKFDEYLAAINRKVISYYGGDIDTIVEQRPELTNRLDMTKDSIVHFIVVTNLLYFVSAYYDSEFKFPVIDTEQKHLSFFWSRMPNGRCQVVCVMGSPRCEAEFFNAETGEKKTVVFNPLSPEAVEFCEMFVKEMKPNKEKDALKKIKD
jgi:hypothetical protein